MLLWLHLFCMIMGIFNMMIVIPMLIHSLTFPLIYHPLLGGDSRNAILFGGVFLLCASVTMIWVKDPVRSTGGVAKAG